MSVATLRCSLLLPSMDLIFITSDKETVEQGPVSYKLLRLYSSYPKQFELRG